MLGQYQSQPGQSPLQPGTAGIHRDRPARQFPPAPDGQRHRRCVELAACYDLVPIHKTLRVTPAMAAGVTDRLWEVSDIVALLEPIESKPGKRGPYKKREAA
jgi:hypothetical protein